MNAQITESIEIRELDKRLTYAKFQCGCFFDNCDRKITHWLTRSNEQYCQCDLVCNFHAQIWADVKTLVARQG